MKDEKRLISRMLVDNDSDYKYMYEILTFTGSKRTASCNSKVQFVLTGEEGETPIRTLDPGWEGTLRKGCVDSYVMKVPKLVDSRNFVFDPLGRLKHDW